MIKSRILSFLRANLKGSTVTEVSRDIRLNRNSTAKYLDILRVNGLIDMRPLGRAKVFYISQRVPISALLDFSADYILVLDGSMRIVEVNENFQKFFHVKKEMLLDVPLLQSNLPIFTSRESQKKIRNAINGKSSNFDMEIIMEEDVRYFKGKLIPSTLGDGGNGVTLIMENITDQKLVEMRLKDSTDRYRELIENQGEGVGITDSQDVFIFANPAAEKLMGVGPGRLVGRSVMDFLVGDHSKRVLNHNERRKKGKKDTYQIEILAEDGKRKTILLTATPRFDSSRNFIGSFGVFRDITQMKENERRMSESEERYRLLYEFTSDAILILKGTGVIDCNDSTLKMFGYSRKEDMIGLEPQNLSPPLQLNGAPTESEIGKKISEVLEKGLITFKWIHQRKDRDTFLAEVQLQSIKIGEESLLQARLRDITDIVKAQKELQNKEAKLKNILSSLHGSFIGLINRSFVFEDFWGTKELDVKYGMKGMNLIGRSILDFIPDGSMEILQNDLKRIFQDGTPFRVEHKILLPNGKFWQEWSFSPFKTGKDNIEYIVQFGRDTQEKNEMIEKLIDVKQRYKLLDSNLTDMIWMTDLNLKYTYISSSAKDHLGYTADELLGTSLFDLVKPSALDEIIRRFSKEWGPLDKWKSAEMDSYGLELELEHKDGDFIWTEINVNLLRNEEGEPIGLIGVMRNITD